MPEEEQELENCYVAYLYSLAHKWSSSGAAALLTPELIKYLRPRFYRCSTPLRVRVILSTLYLSDEVRLKAQESLIELLGEAEIDQDEWVRKLARLASSYVLTGAIDVRETDSETAFNILRSISEQRESKHLELFSVKGPLEAPHLSNVMTDKMFASCNDTTSMWKEDGKEADLFSEGSALLWRAGVTCCSEGPFVSGFDFMSYTKEIMRKGDVALTRVLKQRNKM